MKERFSVFSASFIRKRIIQVRRKLNFETKDLSSFVGKLQIFLESIMILTFTTIIYIIKFQGHIYTSNFLLNFDTLPWPRKYNFTYIAEPRKANLIQQGKETGFLHVQIYGQSIIKITRRTVFSWTVRKVNRAPFIGLDFTRAHFIQNI